ncbi:MAG: pilin [bacterium]|nr:pilin [bacterium]
MSVLQKRIGIILAGLAMLLAPLLAVGAVSAQGVDIIGNLDKGTCLSTTEATCDTEDPDVAINRIIETVINIFSLVVGVVSVIMIIIGGFRYITSGGESAGTTSAKNTILFAIVGLIVVALSQVIVRFVLGRVTGTTAA